MCKRGDVVLVNYPFVTAAGIQQKLRPALVISDHSKPRRYPDDVVLAAITSQHMSDILPNEVRLAASDPGFAMTGLKVPSVLRLDFLMTVPRSIIRKVIGHLSPQLMAAADKSLKRSLGLP